MNKEGITERGHGSINVVHSRRHNILTTTKNVLPLWDIGVIFLRDDEIK